MNLCIFFIQLNAGESNKLWYIHWSIYLNVRNVYSVAMGELGQQHKSTQQHGGFVRSSLFFSYTCYRESLEGSRVTKSATFHISVFTECFLRDTPQTRFILCSIKRKLAVSLKLKDIAKGTQHRKLHGL